MAHSLSSKVAGNSARHFFLLFFPLLRRGRRRLVSWPRDVLIYAYLVGRYLPETSKFELSHSSRREMEPAISA